MELLLQLGFFDVNEEFRRAVRLAAASRSSP